MATKLASASVSRSDAMRMYASRKALYETRDDERGPLQTFIRWLRQELPRFREDEYAKFMKIGREQDDFALLYYYEGTRYKICKDGRAWVSGADADDMHERAEKSLQSAIDTMLNDALVQAFKKAVSQAGARSSSPKYKDGEGDGAFDIRTNAMIGVIG